MMQINISNNEFELNGHAETKVCAMVTALSISLCNGITKVLGENFYCEIGSGVFKYKKDTLSEDAKLLVHVFEQSIVDLARDYPNWIKVNFIDQALMS